MDCRENPTLWPEDTRFDEDGLVVVFYLDNEEEIPVRFERSFRWAVCGVCQGAGKHVNPSIDADHGITAQEFADDPGFADDYMAGVYSVTCVECGGRRVVPELRDPCPELDDWQSDIYDHRRECEAERRMGA